MKKSQLNKELRKIATRESMEKRKNRRPADPFSSLLAMTNRYSTVENKRYQDFEDEEEYYYG